MSDMRAQSVGMAPSFVPRSEAVPEAGGPDVSVAGVLLLSAVAVFLAILSVVVLGVLLMSAWWLLTHVPLPAPVQHLLAWAHLR